MSKEYLEAYFKIDNTLCLNSQNIKFGIDEDDHIDCQNIDEVVNCLETIKEVLDEFEAIDNSEPSEALVCLLKIYTFSEDVIYQFEKEYNTIKQALLKAQEKEKEKLLFKNIHNTKVKTPLVSIFEGLSKDERFKFTEHIYYHWEEMKEALEDKNNELEKENAELKAKAQKERKVLEIIKKKLVDVSLIKKYDFVEDYNSAVWIAGRPKLVKEEFNLLKEVLK